ncbi:hypothetical protein BT63DRAFT_75167 [Microthyrium microscopicum]|uniref:Uncharacterized protein n=1 Tax=Microthyrium microscopicum TaxID=703497 RepID=A0A6A6U0E0_9PEZI|nr:hypothetical protein BT63DRAFT_75167 [Microthyrium microscopicum]
MVVHALPPRSSYFGRTFLLVTGGHIFASQSLSGQISSVNADPDGRLGSVSSNLVQVDTVDKQSWTRGSLRWSPT